MFIGFEQHVKGRKKDPTAARVPLSLLDSGDSFFAEYQPHNSNAFIIANSFVYMVESDNKPRYLAGANVNYYVI